MRKKKEKEVSVMDDVIGNFAGRPARVIIVAITMIAIIFPLYWLVTSSFKVKADYLANPPVIFPHRFTLESFQQVLQMNGLLNQFITPLLWQRYLQQFHWYLVLWQPTLLPEDVSTRQSVGHLVCGSWFRKCTRLLQQQSRFIWL